MNVDPHPVEPGSATECLARPGIRSQASAHTAIFGNSHICSNPFLFGGGRRTGTARASQATLDSAATRARHVA
jgi:hypothetical protein